MSTALFIENGWIESSPLDFERVIRLDGNMAALWEVKYFDHCALDTSLIEKLGGHMVERRPDGIDCEHIPAALLGKLYGDTGENRAVVLPFDEGREVLFVENHRALFYHKFRLPIPNEPTVAKAQLAIKVMLDMCDAHAAKPEWLMCWRCSECGGYVLSVPGKDRIVEFFTETIDKQFADINDLCKLPDDWPAKTCIDCGDISISAQEAREVGCKPSEEEASKFLDAKVEASE